MPARVRFAICIAAALVIGALWSRISLPYSNPDGIVGPLSRPQFHPLNNLVRYLLFVLVPAGLWLLLRPSAALSGARALAVPDARPGSPVFPRLTCVFIWLWAVTEWLLGWSRPWEPLPMDLFHLGEIVTPAYVYRISGGIWTESFFAHGAIQDLFLVHWSWWLAGRESIASSIPLQVVAGNSWIIGMAFFLTSLLISLSGSVRPRSVSLLGVVFVLVVDLGQGRLFQFSGRDSATLIGFGLLLLAARAQRKLWWAGVGVLIPLAALNSIDRGAYLAFVSLVVLLGPPLVRGKPREMPGSRLLLWLTGMLLGWGMQLVVWGTEEFEAFLSNGFFWIRDKDYLDAYVYPSPLDAQSWLQALPLWGMMLAVLGLAACLRFYQAAGPHGLMPVHLLLTTAAFAFFRNGLGRSDVPHLMYSWHFVLLALLYLLWLGASALSLRIDRLALPGLWLLGALCLLQMASLGRGLEGILSTRERIRDVSKLPDEAFLEEPVRAALPQLRLAFRDEDCTFVLPTEPLWYYLLRIPPCTRFHATWFAAPRTFQEEVIGDLEQHRPGRILYSSDSWTDAIDGIEKEERFPVLVDYLKRTYRPWHRIGSFSVYERIEATR